MRDTWQILRDGGLPLAIAGSDVARTPRELAQAVRAAIAEQPTGRDAEALAAFVFAWHQHWPQSFTAEFVGDTAGVLAWATRAITDDDRYLKLRRIALENLARVL